MLFLLKTPPWAVECSAAQLKAQTDMIYAQTMVKT